MAYLSHAADALTLGPPFLLADEAVFVIPKGEGIQLRRHHFKLLFVLSGGIEHEIEGLPGRRPLEAGDILVAPVVGRHHYINSDGKRAASVHLVRLFLDADFLKRHARRRVKRPEGDLGDFILRHFTRVVQLQGGFDNEITALIHDFREETERRRAGYRHRIRSICSDLIVSVSRKLGETVQESASARSRRSGQIVSAAKEYILKHLSTDLVLGEIAWHVGKGEEHLARVFKRETGQSVFDYVREMRIHHAKTLLQDPSLSLTRIAECCGFHSLSFFSRTFRQQTNLSPSLYRQHIETAVQPQTPFLTANPDTTQRRPDRAP